MPPQIKRCAQSRTRDRGSHADYIAPGHKIRTYGLEIVAWAPARFTMSMIVFLLSPTLRPINILMGGHAHRFALGLGGEPILL
jgi:hypothetical protein